MARKKKQSRTVLTLLVVAVLGVGLAYAFWPRPLLVDIGTVTRGPMRVTINEEGRTQVHNAYVVSTPVAGRLLRVEVEPGDVVTKGSTVVAQMLPISPSALDLRTREQAGAMVTASEAALRVAQADLNKALADKELVDANLDRTRKLAQSGIASKAALEHDAAQARAAKATLDTTRAVISMRIAELNNARAQLISFNDRDAAGTMVSSEQAIPLYAPASGVILRIQQQSETTLPAGTPVMEIGDISDDLEVVVELLSTDAVQVRIGAPVSIENWGGDASLKGTVTRIEPWGYTKFSALGVEEQRVKTTIRFTGLPEARASLGHGFRVEARIVVWEAADAVIVPASSLFRTAGNWTIFVVSDAGTAELREVEIAANSGLYAAIASGVSAGERLVLYPSAALEEGSQVEQRTAEGA